MDVCVCPAAVTTGLTSSSPHVTSNDRLKPTPFINPETNHVTQCTHELFVLLLLCLFIITNERTNPVLASVPLLLRDALKREHSSFHGKYR